MGVTDFNLRGAYRYFRMFAYGLVNTGVRPTHRASNFAHIQSLRGTVSKRSSPRQVFTPRLIHVHGSRPADLPVYPRTGFEARWMIAVILFGGRTIH
jgi:hypothetical protein